MKKALIAFVTLLVLGSMLASTAFAAPPPITSPYELLNTTMDGGSPQTIDPGFCYDTASAELIMNVYDTLITFDGEHMDHYLGMAASEWVIEELPAGTTSPEGLPWYFRYTFKIREGMKWHDSAFGTVTPADVEYSIERGMALDMVGGPQWMFYEPLLNSWGVEGVGDPTVEAEAILIGKKIDHAIESNATHVWFNLAFEGAYAPFMQILSQSWASIYSKAWANSLGRPIWNGEWGDYTGWVAFYNPGVPPLDDPSPVMMGSGPFVYETLDYTLMQWSVARFVDYWRGWPADFPKLAGAQPRGYINHFVTTWAFDYPARSTKFLNGESDFCDIPRQYKDEILGKPGIRCVYPLPQLSTAALFYNQDIDPTSPFGPILDYGVLDESGIARDFFANINVRKAFSHAIDYATFIQATFLGEAQQPPTGIAAGLPYYDATIQKYNYDPAKAEQYFKLVPGLWETGFTVQGGFNTGNLARQNALLAVKAGIEALNPKFHVVVTSADWQTYLYARDHAQLTCFALGWLADYPDIHNFAYAFYYTYGNFAYTASYSDAEIDSLILEGIATPDGPERAAIYKRLQERVIETCPSVGLYQAIGRHFERDWMVGYYYNPIYAGFYAYNLWKWYYQPQADVDTSVHPMSNSLPVDTNYDGKVNIVDITVVAGSFGSSFGPPMHPRWVFRADIDNNRIINIIDIAAVAKYFTKTSAVWTPPA